MKLLCFDSGFIEVCFEGVNKKYAKIDSDNGSVTTRWQAIFRTKSVMALFTDVKWFSSAIIVYFPGSIALWMVL